VTVSGPGISPAIVFNVPVGTDSIARDTLELTAGAGRHFRFAAYDSAGIETHRADTTITLLAGQNTPLAVRLAPLLSSLGITVTFGGVRVQMSDTSTRTLLPGDSIGLVATATYPNGVAVPSDSIVWGSSNPAVAVVTAGRVRAIRSGTARVSAQWRGAAIAVTVAVIEPVGGSGSLAVGSRHACALTIDGTAYCWGDNAGFGIYGGGAIGDGTEINRTVPTQVSGGLRFASIHIGVARSFTCARTFAGEAYCWGSNTDGQLGDGTTTRQLTPVRAAPGHTFVAISTDHRGACGLKADGTVLCWGDNSFGQLGNGTTATSLTPVTAAVSGARRLYSGIYLTCVERDSPGLLCWGRGDNGEFGDGTRNSHLTPTLVDSGRALQDVSVSVYKLCGRRNDGIFRCWGTNFFGEIGDSTRTDRLVPTPVVGTTAFATATGGGFGFQCELTASGNPYCWGTGEANEFGSLPGSPAPSPIQGAPPLVSLASGGFACGLDATGRVFCWGRNEIGQLGDGTTTSRAQAGPVNTALRFRVR
jgi:alpha-tubulin suppressor-like RCC1 family protein